jgi:sugar transferase (PEP-CTERM/EpsH1 system associated)
MQPLLYLVHRMPYPPNKGDKIRSYHLLRYLSRHYRVYLGTFADMEGDAASAHHLRELCAEVKVIPLSPMLARARCMSSLLRGEPLTLAWYRSAAMQRWVAQTIAARGIEKAVCFSSAMTLYLDRPGGPALVADFCDVDSDKWAQYAEGRGWPASVVFSREARTLLAFERRIAAKASACTFVTQAEVELFASLAPECAGRLHAIGNGVDTDYFAPRADRTSPYGPNEKAIVFTGAMDYWPNIDAVTWFARKAMPQIAETEPGARFYVVGMNPAPAVTALSGPNVVVTGRVADTRPFLQHARVAVAPLRVARGVQNKVFEAMAMARPVVVSATVAQGLEAAPLVEFDVAHDSREFAHKVLALVDPYRSEEMGRQARRRVVSDYGWDARLGSFGELVESAAGARLAMAG